MIANLLFYTFIAVSVIQLCYFLFIFRKLSFYTRPVRKEDANKTPPVSVIICAKNEAHNLAANIPAILNQQYPTFELVLINDASSDDTLAVMEGFAASNRNVKIVDVENIEAFWGNKKYALTLGIKSASYDHLLFTDADCKPAGNAWIAKMMHCFTDQKTIVLGYSPYEKVKKSLVNVLIRFETLITGIQYISYANLGIPYMGVGRNLAYHRSEFFRVKGFVNHMKLLSGDDDLFVNQVATKRNATVCLQPESFMVSSPKRTFRDWFRQKRRHVSTASYYKFHHKFLLGLYYISNLMFWITLIVLMILFIKPLWVGAIAIILVLLKTIFYKKAFSKLGDTSVWWSSPFLEIFLITIQFAIFIVNRISKPRHWK
ncbi:glycosyltransferase [Flavobacteriaceae bacterium M23B6Z8]